MDPLTRQPIGTFCGALETIHITIRSFICASWLFVAHLDFLGFFPFFFTFVPICFLFVFYMFQFVPIFSFGFVTGLISWISPLVLPCPGSSQLPELTLVFGPPIPSWAVEQGFDDDFTGAPMRSRCAAHAQLPPRKIHKVETMGDRSLGSHHRHPGELGTALSCSAPMNPPESLVGSASPVSNWLYWLHGERGVPPPGFSSANRGGRCAGYLREYFEKHAPERSW